MSDVTVNTNGRQIFNMTLPRKGPVDVPITLDFQTEAVINVDMTPMIDNNFVDYLSGVYLDNSNNPNDLEIICNGTTQRAIWPAYAIGYLPLLLTNPPKLIITSGGIGAGVITTAHFYNIPMMPFITYPSGNTPSSNVNIEAVGGNPVTDNLPVEVVNTSPIAVYTTTDNDWRYYYCLNTGYTAYAAATDMFNLICPSNTQVEILYLGFSGNATAATLLEIDFITRSTANSGGTSINATVNKYNSNYANSAVQPLIYTAAPTIGSTLGLFSRVKVTMAAATAASTPFVASSSTSAQARNMDGTNIILNSGQSISINSVSAIPAGFNIQIFCTWRERSI